MTNYTYQWLLIPAAEATRKMAHGSSAAAINESIHAIIMAKPIDTLTGHLFTENVDHLEEKMEKIAPPYAPQRGAANKAAPLLP